MKQYPLLIVSIAFILGIYLSEQVLLGLLLPTFLLSGSLVFLFYINRLDHGSKHGALKSGLLIFSFFILGSLFYEQTKSENDSASLKNQYLKGDFFVGEIIAVSHGQHGFQKTEVEVHQLIRGKDTLDVNDQVVLFISSNYIVQANEVFVFNTELQQIVNKKNPGEFDAEFYWKHKGIEYLAFVNESQLLEIGKSEAGISDFFLSIRDYFSSLLNKYLDGDELGVAKALILGDRSSLDAEVTAKFGNTGAMHILAVSGLHVGILIQILTYFFAFFKKWISKKNAILISLLLVWVYACTTGLSASVLRSVVMFTILVAGNVWQRNYNPYNVLAFSALVILIWNPHFLFDIGFQLSYLAMLGIFMFYKPLSKTLYIKNKILKAAYDGTMVGIAAQIMTLPFTLYYFNQFPNYFILTNLGLMVFSFLILVLGVGLFSFSWSSLLAKPLAWVLAFSLTVMLWIISFIDALPEAVSYGFILHKGLVLVLLVSIFLLFYAIHSRQMSYLRWSLIIGSIVTCWLVSIRFMRMESDVLFFAQCNQPTFIWKQQQNLYVFYAGRKTDERKSVFVAKNFQKQYPGKIRMFNIADRKKSILQCGGKAISIERLKGGYSITCGKQAYFYALKNEHASFGEYEILAPWLPAVKGTYALKSDSFLFFQ